MQTQINILPFLCEAFATNKHTYKFIDEVYQKDKLKFYLSAKNHELYNHDITKEGSLLQEEYFKKILGILLNSEEYNDDIENIIKHGWHHVYLYVKNNSIIDMDKYLYTLQKKCKGIDNLSDDELNGYFLILVALANAEGKEINTTSVVYKGFIQYLHMRTTFYQENSKTRFNYDNVSIQEKERTKRLKNQLFSIYGPIKNFSSLMATEEPMLKQHINMIGLLFDTEKISANSIFADIDLSPKDIEEILFLYTLENNNINLNNAAVSIADYIYIKYLIKAYKQVKEHYFLNNKETMFVELEKIQQELKTTQALLKNKDTTIKEQQEYIKKLERENARLQNEIEEYSQHKTELATLREFLFNMDKQEQYSTTLPDYSKLNNIKGVIIGGHENWQRRMKELLPSFKFIHPDTLNFDVSIFDNVSIVFFYTNYLNHAIYYKAINEARKRDINIAYIAANTNENIVLNQIYKSVFPE